MDQQENRNFRLFGHARQNTLTGFEPVYDPMPASEPGGHSTQRVLSTLPHRCHLHQEEPHPPFSLDWLVTSQGRNGGRGR